MGIFERVFCFVVSTFYAFIIIISMSNLGKSIGFESMEELGIAIIFGAVNMHLAMLDNEKKDKEEKE
jgi:hypothetical protein